MGAESYAVAMIRRPLKNNSSLLQNIVSFVRLLQKRPMFAGSQLMVGREVGGWGRDPKKCTGRGWGMGSSTI